MDKVAPQRVLFFSDKPYVTNNDGAVVYVSDELIRCIVIYGDAIEYDVTFHTNNVGSVDHRAYPLPGERSRRIAFVGDSFTSGIHAGNPWVPGLGESNADLAVYNLGVGGTGIKHFVKRVFSFEDQSSFNEIVIFAIRSDFFRGFWVPYSNDTGGWH